MVVDELNSLLASLVFTTPLYIWIVGLLFMLLVFIPWAGKNRGLGIDLHYWRKEVAFKTRRAWILLIPIVLVSALVFGAISDPWEIDKKVTYIYGNPVMLVIDVSGSMGAGNNQVTAYQQSLEVFDDLIGRRGDINFGLILYSAESYIARYFINKNELFKDTLENKADIIEISNGTWPTEALSKARRFLTEEIAGDGETIIFISDLHVLGQEAVNLTQEIVRISLTDISLFILATGDENLRSVEIPQAPGVRVIDMNDKSGIDLMCEQIKSIHMSAVRQEESKSEKSLIPYLLLPASGLFILCLILGETRFRKIP